MLRSRWEDLLDGFWLVPGLVAATGFLLALALLGLDHLFPFARLPIGFSGSAATARSLLSTIAGALITVAGLVFSVTMVALQLVSSQFTSRALRGILSNRLNQVVTGGLVGIFTYCMFILVAIRDKGEGDSTQFVPALSVSMAFLLAFVGLILLMMFIGYTSQSLQVSHITADIAGKTLRSLAHRYPGVGYEQWNDDGKQLLNEWEKSESPTGIYAASAGYVQTISLQLLASVAHKADLRLSLRVCPGDFVTPETIVADVWPADAVDTAIVEAIQNCISVSRERDMLQDPSFGVRQLADIALRALSHAINDPTTAVLAIGYLEAIFERIAGEDPLADILRLKGDECAIVARYVTFEEYLQVFVEIGRYAWENARVVNVLLDAVAHIAEAVVSHNRPERLLLLGRIAAAIALPAIQQAKTTLDRTSIREHLHNVERITGTESIVLERRG
jgi:uncharacterized membrane protein